MVSVTIHAGLLIEQRAEQYNNNVQVGRDLA